MKITQFGGCDDTSFITDYSKYVILVLIIFAEHTEDEGSNPAVVNFVCNN